MFGLGMQELVVIGIVGIVIASVSSLRRKGNIHISGPALVLRKFDIKKTPKSETDDIINISGRASGLWSWLLTVVGIEAETTIKVTGREITFKSTSLFGQQHAIVALTSISSVHCGYLKPISFLIVAGVCALLGLSAWISGGGFSSFIAGLFVGTIFAVLYWLLKKVEILVHTRGSLPLGLVFKRSVIENVPVDIERAKIAIGIINNLIISSQNTGLKIQDIEEAIKVESKDNVCAHCGGPLEKGARFCTSCGHGV